MANLGRRDRLKDSGALDNLAAAFTRLDPAPGRFLSGALPLAVPMLRRLDVESIVDRACPSARGSSARWAGGRGSRRSLGRPEPNVLGSRTDVGAEASI